MKKSKPNYVTHEKFEAQKAITPTLRLYENIYIIEENE